MAPELRHALDKFKAAGDGFQGMHVSATGAVMAIYRFTPMRFQTLEEFQEWLYADAAVPATAGKPALTTEAQSHREDGGNAS